MKKTITFRKNLPIFKRNKEQFELLVGQEKDGSPKTVAATTGSVALEILDGDQEPKNIRRAYRLANKIDVEGDEVELTTDEVELLASIANERLRKPVLLMAILAELGKDGD